MDHKVSKDMISSGMIPSGEKTQADLGRTQYGSAPSPSKLMDAYKSMYEHHKKDADGNTIPHEGEELNEVAGLFVQPMKKAVNPKKKTTTPQLSAEGKIPAGLQAYLDKKKGKKEDKKEVKEEADMFDIILEHYLNEGYQREDILKAMSSLSEEPLTLAAIGGLLAKGGAMAAKGAAVAGKVAAKGGAMAAKGLASAGKTVAANVGKAAKGIASVPGKISAGVKKVGGAAKNFYGNEKISPFVKQQVTQSAIDLGTKAVGSMKPKGLQKKPSGTISASADLFDIVKGQLLDEGLSEEEIKDIMLTLTPDEIMEELSDVVKRNDAINKANAMKAAQERKVPDKVREASKRQYTAGGPKDTGANKYTTQDKKTIIDYNKNKESM